MLAILNVRCASQMRKEKKTLKIIYTKNNNYKIIHNVFAYATEWFIFKLIILYIIIVLIIIIV